TEYLHTSKLFTPTDAYVEVSYIAKGNIDSTKNSELETNGWTSILLANESWLETQLSDKLLVFNICILFFGILVQMLSFIYVKLNISCTKLGFYPCDRYNTKDFLFFVLQIWDFFSDIMFCNNTFNAYISNTKNSK